MSRELEAVVLFCKCAKTNRYYGIRAGKINNNHWLFTWAFPLREENAHHEGYDKTSIKGIMEIDPDYPGCPYCGTNNLIVCDCGHIFCKESDNGTVTCPWCKRTGKTSKYTGREISAGLDA